MAKKNVSSFLKNNYLLPFYRISSKLRSKILEIKKNVIKKICLHKMLKSGKLSDLFRFVNNVNDKL